MLGGFKRALGLCDPVRCGSQSCIRGVQRLFALIKQFLVAKPFFNKALGPIQFLRG